MQRSLFDGIDEDILSTYSAKISKVNTIKDKETFQKEVNLLLNEFNNILLENMLKFKEGKIDSNIFNNIVKISVAIKNNIENYNSINENVIIDENKITNIIIQPTTSEKK